MLGKKNSDCFLRIQTMQLEIAWLISSVWFQVHAAAPRIVIIVANALMNSETLSGTQQRIMVEKLLEKISD